MGLADDDGLPVASAVGAFGQVGAADDAVSGSRTVGFRFSVRI